MKDEDVLLDEILAKGSLGGPVRDQILERVLAGTAPTRVQKSVRVLPWLAIPCVAVAAAWLVVARPVDRNGFISKGGVEVRAGAVDAACSPGGLRVCRNGETLVFTVNSAVASGYLGAYAERVGAVAPERIWYFPRQGEPAPVVEPGTGTIAVRNGVQIGPEHQPGTYRITAWIADRPIDRAQVGPTGPRTLRDRWTMELTVVR